MEFCEWLEVRIMLSGSLPAMTPRLPLSRRNIVHTTLTRSANRPAATSPPGSAITPAQMRHAYGIDQVLFGGIVGDGSGQTVAIIDAYHYPTALFDLQQFDAAFGLPDLEAWSSSGNTGAYLRIVSQTGGTNYPSTDPAGAGAASGTWEMEEALDIQWVHAIAPGANIILVEANSPSDANLLTAGVGWARSQPGVCAISMSFSQGEFASETTYDSLFTTPAGHAGVTFFAATGDTGQPSGYPAFSPNVVAVGGTTLTTSGGNYLSESGWSGSGGSLSTMEGKPSYQNGVVTQSSTWRANPDVAMDADPGSGVPIYDSWDYGGSPWQQFGGTSLATPMWAGIMAIIDQGRVLSGQTALDGRTQTLPKLYQLPASDFHDITTGNNGFAAGAGFDLVTGLGTPVANFLIADMVAPPSVTPGVPDLTAESDSGVSSSDNITNLDNSVPGKALTFSVGGTVAGAAVSIFADGVAIGSAVASGSTTLVTTNGSYTLASGTHAITATQTQPGLGQSAASAALSVAIDSTKPTVASQFPSGSVSGPQSDIKFTFAEAIDTSTFDPAADIGVFTDPSGQDLRGQITGYAWSAGNTVLDVQFNAQSAVGTYLMTLGPQIFDLGGNSMAASYSATFTIIVAIYSATMDSNPGWTLDAGTPWAWGQPAGAGSHNHDAASGHRGTNVVGYNLAGDYAKNTAASYTTTQAIDCTNYQNLTFSFWRWLGVRSSATASVQASSDGGTTWTVLWSNNGTTVSDSAWTLQQFTLPASFAGKSAVMFRWAMGPTGSSNTTYPGWNIDDVLLSGAPYVPPSISGQVFLDANGNGAVDAGEAGIAGAAVFLDLNGNGVRDAAGTTNAASTNVPVTIPDLSTVTSNLIVAGAAGTITSLTISFNISHTYDSDLAVYLIGPDNTQITLFSGVGGSGQNFAGTTLSDSAATAITSGAAPFAGTFRPSPGVLSAFNGKSANGTWQLKIVDSVAVDSGVLNSWSLSINSAGEPMTTTDGLGNYVFNVAAGTYTVREILPASYVAVAGLTHTVGVTAAVTGQNFANFPTVLSPGNAGGYFVALDAGGSTLRISNGTAALVTPTFQIAASLVPNLTFNLMGTQQSLMLDFSNGSPLAFSLTVNSVHGGNGQLTILGHDPLQEFTLTDSQINLISGGVLLFNGLDNLTMRNCTIDFSGHLSTFNSLTFDGGSTLNWG